jgi:DNA-binding response OmpR family regulator
MVERVLIVDDDSLICELFKMMLSRVGFQTRAVLSGRQAFQELEKTPADIILLDIMMAETDGIEVLRRLRADTRYARVPVIILTAMTESSNRRRSLELGANSILIKPVDPDQLINEVRKVLDADRAGSQLINDMFTSSPTAPDAEPNKTAPAEAAPPTAPSAPEPPTLDSATPPASNNVPPPPAETSTASS